MTVLVALAPERPDTGVLPLGIAIARSLAEPLELLTVSPPPWGVPSMARVDAEFSEWADHAAADAQAGALAVVAAAAPELPVQAHRAEGRSIAATLSDEADRLSATVLVIGSSGDVAHGRIGIGSTGDRLVHSATHLLAIAPLGYTGPRAGFTRLTCAVSGRGEDAGTVRRAVALAARAGVPLRVVTFAVRHDTMYPPEVGLDAEEEIVRAAHDQAEGAFDGLRREGVIDADVETVVAVGRGWRGAVEDLAWDLDEVLLIGSRPQGRLSRVFLGSSATKIVRHATVPVMVLPA